MAIKYTNIFHCKTLQNLTKLVVFGLKILVDKEISFKKGISLKKRATVMSGKKFLCLQKNVPPTSSAAIVKTDLQKQGCQMAYFQSIPPVMVHYGSP
jgi:hypothetical protein